MASLFSAINLGGEMDPIVLKHRIIMAPVTRFRSDEDGVVLDIVKTCMDKELRTEIL